ncbi:MAG TPA: hypothetical protein VJY34_24595 [Roseiarcus sp.]|nr:hypothetical protein [Roseiarcus sp.]
MKQSNWRSQVCDFLAAISGWFTEGFDTFDVKKAKVLVEELS